MAAWLSVFWNLDGDIYSAVFPYTGDLDHQVGYLGIRTGNSTKRLALVTHPLLYQLSWQRYSEAQPNTSFYQRNQTYSSIADIKEHWPNPKEITVDSIIAERWQLDEKSYQPLDSLTSLDTINYIITSYSPPLVEGIWRSYRQVFDVTDAFVSEEKQLFWWIILPDVKGGKVPFRLGSIHIDYRSMR